MKNLGTIDRLLRVILAEFCILTAFFWVAQDWQILLYLVAAAMLIQAATGRCGLYSILGWNSCELIKRRDKNLVMAFIIFGLALAVVGSYASAVLTKNIFLEDLNKVNAPYSLVLRYSSQGLRQDTIEQYEQLEGTFGAFKKKYSKYKPLTVEFDRNFANEMTNISEAMSKSKEDVYLGNLTKANKELQKAEPTFKKILEQNDVNGI